MVYCIHSKHNPTTYLGATLDWSNGRQLTSYTKGSNNITYTYDADGLRVTKTVNGVKHTYLYVDGLLVYEKQYKANTTDVDMYFWYDGNGHLAAMSYYNNLDDTTAMVYALTNVMGDVLALYSGNGNLLVTYEYDAWGNLVYMYDPTAIDIGTINPIRYRGYYYDADTGLYYCQSRYYNPQVGRWLNADGDVSTGTGLLGHNMYAYCLNNPVNMIDADGRVAAFVVAAGWVIVAGLCLIGITAIVTNPNFQKSWDTAIAGLKEMITRKLRALALPAVLLASQVASISTSISNSFAKVKSIPKYRSPREVHHIVAQKAPNAKLARNIINAVGIGYNSPYNLMSIKTGLHRRLHTNSYYGWANSVVISAYRTAGNKRTRQRNNVITALNTIRAFVSTMDAIAPF